MSYLPNIDPDPREVKLPRWARELLSDMRLRVERAERTAEAARLNTEPDRTDTILYRYGDADLGLPLGSTIQFRLDPTRWRKYVQCRIESTKHGIWLDVSGGDSIRLMPRSGNSVRITLDED